MDRKAKTKPQFFISQQPQKDYNKSSYVITRVDSKSISRFFFANIFEFCTKCFYIVGESNGGRKGKRCHLKASLTVLYSHKK